MSSREPRDVGRFVASLLALSALVVAVPVGLVLVAQNRFGSGGPLAGMTWPWRWTTSDIGDALSSPLADDDVIDLLIRLSLSVVWVATFVIVVTTAVELAHMIRHRGIAMPTVRGFGWAQRTGRFIALGLLVVIPVMSPRPSIASGTADVNHSRSALVAQERADEEPIEDPAEAAGVNTMTVHVVQAGESVYSIASALSGGDEREIMEAADAILELNLGTAMEGGQRFTNPAYIEVAWKLTIPAHLSATSQFQPPAIPPSATSHSTSTSGRVEGPATNVQDRNAPATHIVQRGDTLWSIANIALGDSTRWQEIWEQNAGHEMGGGHTFDDPNLILPGWNLQLPLRTAANEVPPSSASERDLDADAPDLDESPPGQQTTADSVGDVEGDEETANLVGDADSTETPDASSSTAVVSTTIPWATGQADTPAATSTPTSSTTTPVAQAGVDDGSDGPKSEDNAPAAPSPIRIEHAALLAAGILALVAVRRRQRLRSSMPRTRLPEPREDVAVTERRLRAIDAGERAARIDVACRAAARVLVDDDAQIGWVRVSLDGDVALRLTDSGQLPTPWTGNGQDWRLAAGVPIEMLSEDARRVDMPSIALVQLGVSADGEDVLVDLEACGVLAVEARSAQADEVITAVAAGLACSLYAEVAHLITVSLPEAALLGHRNAHATASVDAAFELAVSLVGSTLTDERTSFVLRSLRTGGEVWEPAIILLTSEDDADQITNNQTLPPIGHGLAVVAAAGISGLPTATSRLLAEPRGWTLHAFGSSIPLSPIGLSEDELGAVVDVLDEVNVPLEEAALAVGDLDVGNTTPFNPMPHEICVRLIGSIDVIDRNGEKGQFERSKTVEFIAWLATHRDRGTRTGARTALWELDVRDATFANVVSEARRAMGRLVAPPDGEEWLARTLTEQLPIHDAVVTDAQLMEERLERARVEPPIRAIETLRPAVEMIRDIPFAGTSYLWPDAEGITSNLVLLSISVASDLAAHALSIGDTDDVFWATGQGLRVLPGHEELIGLRMRAHARAGDLAGVRQEWESYERVIVADSWSDGEPAPKLLALRRDLLTAP
jgi:nucleoid-associated protein YgaU